MKKIIIPLIFSLFLIESVTTNAQCKQTFVYACAKENGNAIYLRDFNVKLRGKRRRDESAPVARFSIVLNKGTRYRFNLCPDEDSKGRAVLKLYDGKRKLASTFYKGKDIKSFDFDCKKSAIYYVTISMKDGEKGCAVGILSFVGKN